MKDQPEPTPEEHEMTPEELPAADAMQYPRHEDPELPGDYPPEEPIHES
ncbi:MAG: hypothetical protein ICV59_06800 [Thermoleophilia bacterium]|nr:hypothetical protein [Thermoleophilia bacterium]